MTKIKLCGMTRALDIQYANELMPDYIGFVFAERSRRFVSHEAAEELSAGLRREIIPVGVFVNDEIRNIVSLTDKETIRAVQLHGNEDNAYINELRRYTDCPVIQAFRITSAQDIIRADKSAADYIMLDSGGGTGERFDHSLITGIERKFFLAGGLDSVNAAQAVARFRPYAVDVSSSIETDGVKDKNKMAAFVEAVRKG